LTAQRDTGRLRNAYGIRVLFILGPTRLLRLATAVGLATATVFWLADHAWNVAAIGQDTWNYLAAGERLNAGHTIYQLVPGDRPLLMGPPSPVPLVAPPLVAVLWRPLALLPAVPVMWAWWAVSAAAVLGTAGWIVVRGTLPALVITFVLAAAIGECAASGNLNSFLAPALALAWWSTQSGRPRIAGVLVAAGGCLKIGPGAPALWLAACRQYGALVAGAVTVAILGAVSLAGAGLQAHLDYLDIARQSTQAAGWGASIPGLLNQFHAPAGVIDLSVPAVWILGAVAIWALRHRPAAAFGVSVALAVWGTPVVHITAVALLMALAAPFTPAPAWLRSRPAREPLGAAGA